MEEQVASEMGTQLVHTKHSINNSSTDNAKMDISRSIFSLFLGNVAQSNLEHSMESLILAHKVIASGVPNRYGVRIPVQTKWKINNFNVLLYEYYDRIDLIEWLTFGFPVSRDDSAPDPVPATMNHAGANMYPHVIDNYIRKEIEMGATIGPFTITPFLNRIGISPLSTRPKRDTDSRRIILDLSYPEYCSVNSGIRKDQYCGKDIKLTYPTIDTLTKRIAELGEGCLLWKRDLSRFFRQLPLCPRDYSLISYRWNHFTYHDTMMPMGLVSAAYVAQKTTSGIAYVHNSLGYWVINYLDDFGSAEEAAQAWSSYNLMGRILGSIGCDEATEKAVEPTTRMEFLGNVVDSVKMTIEVSERRREELMSLLQKWRKCQKYSKKQMQSLIGKLSFITNCVRPGRIFLSRLIDSLHDCKEDYSNYVTEEIRKDVNWWIGFLPGFDGTSILWLEDKWDYNELMATDASLIGGGATMSNELGSKEMFHCKFPQHIMEATNNIAQREMLTIVIAIKLWRKQLAGKVIRILTDSQVSMYAINRGRTKDAFMLNCIREIAWVATKEQILLRSQYIHTSVNTLPDALSRWYINAEARRNVKRLTDRTWRRRSIHPELMYFHCPW